MLQFEERADEERERERESLSKQTRLARHVLDCRCQGVVRVPTIMAHLKATLWRLGLSECDLNTQQVEQKPLILMGQQKTRGTFSWQPPFSKQADDKEKWKFVSLSRKR